MENLQQYIKSKNYNENVHHKNMPDNLKMGLNTLNYIIQLDDLHNDLKKCLIFIKRFPLRKYYEENDIIEIDFIKYHHEVLIHKIHTILEVIKIAVNDILKLNIKSKNCNLNSMKTKSAFVNSEFHKLIDAYYKTFENQINHRHLNTHRAIYLDNVNKDLNTKLGLYKLYKKMNIEVDDEIQNLIPEFILESKVKQYKREKVNFFKEVINLTEDFIKKFNILIIDYFLKNNLNNEATLN
ncbi:hypothetical protein EAH69_10595 [Faecalibacter macacae]|uniref:Uncharacterized protein n=2 Tax=Faecalibacter macacae TaxID=1859289 RepID=A0A3L9M529_9FLAO|nr:hypothetical protein EAH69_10595 [Faecalibacter macacae]